MWVWIKQVFRLCYTFIFLNIHALRIYKELCRLLNLNYMEMNIWGWKMLTAMVQYFSAVIFVVSLSLLMFPMSYLSLGLLSKDSQGRRVRLFMSWHSLIACSVLSLTCHLFPSSTHPLYLSVKLVGGLPLTFYPLTSTHALSSQSHSFLPHLTHPSTLQSIPSTVWLMPRFWHESTLLSLFHLSSPHAPPI